MTIGVHFGPYHTAFPYNNYSWMGYPWNTIGYMKLFWSKKNSGFSFLRKIKKSKWFLVTVIAQLIEVFWNNEIEKNWNWNINNIIL